MEYFLCFISIICIYIYALKYDINMLHDEEDLSHRV